MTPSQATGGRKTSLCRAGGAHSHFKLPRCATSAHTPKPQPKINPRPGPGVGPSTKHPTIKDRQKGNVKSDCLSFIQINLKKKRGAWGTLVSNIQGKVNPIILASEPYSNNKNIIPNVHRDLVPYYCNLGTLKPRAAILVHKSINNNCWELQQFTTPDLVAIKCRQDARDIILASVYMDINTSVNSPNLISLINYAKSCKAPLIIGSDTNAHHQLWGNKNRNGRGEDLLDLLNSFGLSWANKGATPTFINSRGHESIIDLTIANDPGCELISNWQVSSKFSNSDHQYIMFDIVSLQKDKPKQVRIVKNTDWDTFNNYLDEHVEELPEVSVNCSTHDLDTACKRLNQHLLNAFESACPVTYISNSIKKPPWLTPEVELAQRGIRHKLKLARSSKNCADWNALRAANKSYNKLLNKSRKDEWNSFCSNTDSVAESARMNKILKSFSGKKEKLESIRKSDNTLTKDADDTLEEMVKSHVRPHHLAPPDPPMHTTVEVDNSLIERIYSPDRLERAVKSFDPGKTPGPDGIHPIILQKSWHAIKDVVRTIMISSHNKHHVPAPWQEASGIFLPKPGKVDYTNPKSFRTISLSSALLKLQEKVILWHMQHDLGMDNCLSKKQYGFRRGTSTESALHKVIHNIERRLAKKGFVLGAFLDIEGAFDNLSFSSIKEALHVSPLDSSTASWIFSMVSNRNITFTLKNSQKRIKAERGCPQGGVLSPFLWNLVLDDLLKFSASQIPGYLQAFADDLMSIAEGNDVDVVWQRTQKTIKTIELWCESKGLNISSLKTKIVMFTWNKKWTLRPIFVGGSPVIPSDSVKLLGVTLDSKLKFNEHIDNITTKAINSLMQCNRAVGPTWGLSPKVCRWIYTSVIRPILSYSVVVWIRALNNGNNTRKLERVQGMALRYMTGAFPSTPFKALNYLTNIPSITFFLRGEAAKGASRLQGYGDWTVETAPSGRGIIKAHSTISNDFLADLGLPKLSLRDLTKPVLILDRSYNVTIPDADSLGDYRQSLIFSVSDLQENSIVCYTDGSRTDAGVGGGFLTTTDNTSSSIISECSFRLQDYCSVFQAELIAIKEGATSLLQCRNKSITIWSDSLSALQALSSFIIKSKTVLGCHSVLSELALYNSVSLRWIAAHSGHWGNERADVLAKTGTSCDNLLGCLMPQSHIKRLINSKVDKLVQSEWDSDPHGHTGFVLGEKQKSTIGVINSNFISNRNQYRMAIHLITGHTGLNKHLHTMTLVDSSSCPYCGCSEETVAHFIGQCPFFARLRGEFFATYYASVNDIFDNCSISKIVAFAIKSNRFKLPGSCDVSGVT